MKIAASGNEPRGPHALLFFLAVIAIARILSRMFHPVSPRYYGLAKIFR